jgi:hypothetical protein
MNIFNTLRRMTASPTGGHTHRPKPGSSAAAAFFLILVAQASLLALAKGQGVKSPDQIGAAQAGTLALPGMAQQITSITITNGGVRLSFPVRPGDVAVIQRQYNLRSVKADGIGPCMWDNVGAVVAPRPETYYSTNWVDMFGASPPITNAVYRIVYLPQTSKLVFEDIYGCAPTNTLIWVQQP